MIVLSYPSPVVLNSSVTDCLAAETCESLPSTASSSQRQVAGAFYSLVAPTPTNSAQLLHVNRRLAAELGFGAADLSARQFAEVMSGNALYEGMRPYATCYGGHQFGHWAGQLGDGRAINLAEVRDRDGQNRTLQLKGAGKTPYSRFADGRAVLRSSLREYMCSEAMHGLGIPTTQALSLCLSGDLVERDMFYNGHAAFEPGAIVSRVSRSFIRFGHFELPAARKEWGLLRQLCQFCLSEYFPHLEAANAGSLERAVLAMFREIAERSADLAIEWARVGFVHAVLNTDNMSIIGETIDYGPFGWLDDYNPNWTPNTSDAQHRRYRFANQPAIVQWNLWQLANALMPIVNDAKALESVLGDFPRYYETNSLAMMRRKLGLIDSHDSDAALIETLLVNMEAAAIDMTLFFRALSDWREERVVSVSAEWLHALSYRDDANSFDKAWTLWLGDYRDRILRESKAGEGLVLMREHNPIVTPRNFLLQEAIDALESGNPNVLEDLFSALSQPYTDSELTRRFARKRPDWALQRPGCASLSCSS